MARQGGRRPAPEVDTTLNGDRGSRILGGAERPRRRRSRGRDRRRQHASSSPRRRRAAVSTSPGWDEVKAVLLRRRRSSASSFREIASAFLTNVKLFCIAEVDHPRLRALARRAARPPRARCSSRSGCSRSSTRTSSAASRRSCSSTCSASACRRSALPGVPTSEFFWGDGRAGARLHGVRVRGVPGRHRVRAPEPERRRPLARPLARRSRSATCRPAGSAPGDPAAAQRLHRPPEGHRARRHCSVSSRRSGSRRSTSPATSTSRRTSRRRSCSSLITIPLTRFTDWLVARDRRRRQAGALA